MSDRIWRGRWGGEGEGWVWCGRGVRRVGVVEGTRKEMKGRVCGCVVGREEGYCGREKGGKCVVGR